MTADARASQCNAGAARTWSSGRAAQRVAIVWYVAQGLSSRSLRPAVTLDLRSEEHTSELQSQSNLVCRLLLEKKNPTGYPPRRGSHSGTRIRDPAGTDVLPAGAQLPPGCRLRVLHLRRTPIRVRTRLTRGLDH